jgi:hypothetical protein
MVKRSGKADRSESPKARAKARLAAFRAGVQSAALGDERTRASLEELASKNKELKSLNEALVAAAAEYAELRQQIRSGKLSRSDAAARIAKAFAPLQRGRLLDVRKRFEAQLPARPRGFEMHCLTALFDGDQLADNKGWIIEGDWAGPCYYKPRGGDFGQRNDPLPGDPDNPPPPGPQPFTDCASPPYGRERRSFSGDGPGLWTGDAFATPATGRATSLGSSNVILVGGAATYGEALVGRDVQWPAGFSNLRVEVEIDVSAYFFAIAVGLSAAGAGGDLILEVSLDNGATARTTLTLGAVVAPVFWWAQRDLSGNFTLSTNIAIPSSAGGARLLAGVVSHTAAGGIAGAGANGDAFGEVKRLCAALS